MGVGRVADPRNDFAAEDLLPPDSSLDSLALSNVHFDGDA